VRVTPCLSDLKLRYQLANMARPLPLTFLFNYRRATWLIEAR
jgi:hypothetical protein